MPSQKSRSKDDTWTTAELDNALKDDREMQRKERREKRERKDKSSTRDEKDRRQRKDKIISSGPNVDDTSRNKPRDKDDDRRKEKSRKDDRNRDSEREERRRRKEGTDDRIGRHKYDDDKLRRERRDRERDKGNNDESERRKSDKRSIDEREKRKADRHKSKDPPVNEAEERERKNDRHKRKEVNGDERDRIKHDRHKTNDGERDKRHTGGERKEKDLKSSTRIEESKPTTSGSSHGHQSEEGDNDYNYDDDFEDYEEDFEDDDEEDEPPMRHEDKDMCDILKALDEENACLAAGSPLSNRSESSEQFEDRYEKKDLRPSNVNRGRTFINFVSAKQRAVDQKVLNKTKKRGKDLLQLIEFDKAAFDIFELLPVKEYDLYIRSFGRTDTKQAYIQTNEDNLDRDIQTEDIEYRDKWTQHPAEDLHGCGGDDIDSKKGTEASNISKQDMSRMSKFLNKAAQAIGILLNEESRSSNSMSTIGNKSNNSISSGYALLGTPLILQGRYVNYACYSPSQPNMLLTSYSSPEHISDNPADTKGIICVWNSMESSNPQKILACESQPTCCCFSPTRAILACAGMTDGSVVVWDLREQACIHHLVKFQQEEYLIRYPTYNTAGISESENHHSPIRSLVPVYPDPTSLQSKQQQIDDVSGLSFQLASLEENAYVNLWVVAEITSPNSAGSELDLGLSPGGQIKLVKSSTIKLNNPSLSDRGDDLQAYEFQFASGDLNHFYVGTDSGFVIHRVRFGCSAFPRGHKSMTDAPVKVKSIDISPFGYPYMLAGCSDGSVQLYHTKLENPLVSWTDLSNGNLNSICCVRWSRSRAGVFFVLDDQSTLYTFDLLEGDSRPVHVDKITSGKAVYLVLNNDSGIINSGSSSRSPQLLLAFDNGTTELHSIKNNLIEQQTLESEFLQKYNERF